MDSKNKATFIWLPLSSKEKMAEFNLTYNSLKSKILQPIHNPTTIYIKILYINSWKLGLHDIIINIQIKKSCCYELKKSSFNMLLFDFKLMNHYPKVWTTYIAHIVCWNFPLFFKFVLKKMFLLCMKSQNSKIDRIMKKKLFSFMAKLS